MGKFRYRKLLALILVFVMVFSLSACGKGETKETIKEESNKVTQAVDKAPTEAVKSGEKRTITVGTWYDHYYTSDHKEITDNPNVTDEETAKMQLDNIRAIEEKYNIELKFVNLTWDGTVESINTSIMAGVPECDIYEVDLQFGIPAVLNGYATDLKSVIPGDNDIFGDQTVLSYMDLSDMGKDGCYLFKQTAVNLNPYPLAFNMDMIEEANLENPQDLYDRGEWTWAKFREYLLALTKDKDGDSVTDVYGYGGWWTNLLNQMLMSNGTHIAGSTTTGVDSPATIEVFDFIYNMYNVDKVAKPWNQDDWNINTSVYADGIIAFWPTAAWVMGEYGGSDLSFEIGVVPWPVGPSGSFENNKHNITAGSYYFVPKGVKDPELVYNVFYDWTNWYDGDTELRDDTEWFENQMITERNFNYLKDMGTKEQFDIWGSLGLGDNFSLVPLLYGEKTASQLAEESKLVVQDALDTYFK